MADVGRNFCHYQANVELGHLFTCSGLIFREVPLMVCTTYVMILMPASLQHKIKNLDYLHSLCIHLSSPFH